MILIELWENVNGMRKYRLLIAFLLFIGISCSKEKSSEIKENLILDFMSAGTWTLDFFTANSVNVLPEYEGYTFQFYRNGSVDAFKGLQVMTGTWYGSQEERSITASFPQGSGPLLRFNTTWFLYGNTLTSVQARAISNNFFYTIRLVKKP